MKKLSLVCLLWLAIACGSDPCDPVSESFTDIQFQLVDGTQDVFGTTDAKKSLQVFSLERNKQVDFTFNNTTFSIQDQVYDELAAADLICPSYILKYRTDDVDTLKICYQIRSDKCEGTQLETVKVFWNTKPMDYSSGLATITK